MDDALINFHGPHVPASCILKKMYIMNTNDFLWHLLWNQYTMYTTCMYMLNENKRNIRKTNVQMSTYSA